MAKKIETRIVNDRLGVEMPLPAYATSGSAALDLRACNQEPVTLEPGQRELFPSGIAVNINDPGLVAIVASRSGLSLKHGVRVGQGIGVIDSDYHGEIGVILINDGDHPYTVNPGDRIAQLLFQPVEQVELKYVDEFSVTTERGTGGFGHSGKS
ncbi:dUTP diphosphatase [Halorhodospira halochloris]|uniref:dUTP diphosphatase n=1 Tax=Halorhodospira halochloris TaxID=1052 RepID=UPI001EE96EE7|nr:dUTP diphosphatase [Halorhodospira halochloris]MCG5529788.1 dUTP diphosphatase [Halorhodospira halochloris]MCG5548957.1 dUTP diphosphatase [Halorhodospira halochloris]